MEGVGSDTEPYIREVSVTYEKVCQEGEDILLRSGPLRVSVDYTVSHLCVLEGTG